MRELLQNHENERQINNPIHFLLNLMEKWIQKLDWRGHFFPKMTEEQGEAAAFCNSRLWPETTSTQGYIIHLFPGTTHHTKAALFECHQHPHSNYMCVMCVWYITQSSYYLLVKFAVVWLRGVECRVVLLLCAMMQKYSWITQATNTASHRMYANVRLCVVCVGDVFCILFAV